jgi:DNA-binding CsgD family transcriptional regulator
LLSEQQAAEMLKQLTAKQTEVLDLLARHLTSKQIARELNLAPNTVDQRITAVREKWGLPNRKALLRQLTEIQEICGKTTYRSATLDEQPLDSQGDGDSESSTDPIVLSPQFPPAPSMDGPDARRLTQPFVLQNADIRFGRLGRVGIALIFALVIALTLAVSLFVAESMGHWL